MDNSVVKMVPVLNGVELEDKATEIEASDKDIVATNVYVDGDLIEPSYMLPANVYNILKWVVILILPALSLFIQNIGVEWGLPILEHVANTVSYIALCIGGVLGISAAKNYFSK